MSFICSHCKAKMIVIDGYFVCTECFCDQPEDETLELEWCNIVEEPTARAYACDMNGVPSVILI